MKKGMQNFVGVKRFYNKLNYIFSGVELSSGNDNAYSVQNFLYDMFLLFNYVVERLCNFDIDFVVVCGDA